jgi:hypothetical protein
MLLIALSAAIARAAVSPGTLSITTPANGYTKSTKVTLTISNPASTAAKYCISNTAATVDKCTAWTAVPTTTPPWTKAWTLTAGDGIKTVYGYLRDSGGVTSALDNTAATIMLDTKAPANGKLTATKQPSDVIQLDWTEFIDIGSGRANYVLAYSTGVKPPANCLNPTVSTILAGASSYTTPALINGATYSFRLCAVDNAGNLSTGATVTSRAVPEVIPPALDTFTINQGSATKSAAVTLKIAATDSSLISKMCISNTSACTAWKTYAPADALKWTLSTGDGPKTVNLWLMDQWDNVNATPYTATILLDTKAPVNGTLMPPDLSGTTATLNWLTTFTDNVSGIASYTLVSSEKAIPTSCAVGDLLYSGPNTTFSYDLVLGKNYYYRVCATDNAGNTSTGATTSILTSPGNATDLVAKAMAALAKQDYAGASIFFESALIADSSNPDANFGSAITKGIMLVENQTVQDIVARWGVVLPPLNQIINSASPVGNPLDTVPVATSIVPKTTAKSVAATMQRARVAPKTQPPSLNTLLVNALGILGEKLPVLNPIRKTAAKAQALAVVNPPSVSEMQAAIDTVLIPALTTITARLAKVEGKTPPYTFTVTAAMQGNQYGQDIILNDGEFYTLDAVVNGVLTLLNIATAYNLDVADYNNDGTKNDYDTIRQDPLKTFNTPSFFTLKTTTGTPKMAAALAAVNTAVTKTDSAYTILKDRKAGEGAFDLSSWTQADKDKFVKTLNQIQTVLNGQTIITIAGNPVTVNAPKFFIAPLSRTELPTLGYDVPLNTALSAKYNTPVAAEYVDPWDEVTTYPIYADIVPKSDLPDYTLNGILPLNSKQDNVAGFTGLIPVLDGKVLKKDGNTILYDEMWSFTSNGADIYCVAWSYYDQTSYVRKITTAGVVTDLASPYWSDPLTFTWYNGSFYVFDSATVGLYKVLDTTDWNIDDSPSFTLNLTENQWLTAITASGTNLYYASLTWYEDNPSVTTEIHRFNPTGGDTLLFTINDQVNAIAYANGSIYLNYNGLSKYAATVNAGTPLATYANGSFDLLHGGNLYKIQGGKLQKKAVAP